MGKRPESVIDLFRLDGKVAIVTGASRGLGKAISLGFAGAGAKVAVAARSEDSLNATSNEIIELGFESIAVQTDVTEYSDLERLVSRTVKDFSRIDVLVNCAGQTRSSPSEDFPQEDWDLTYRSNLKSAFDLCQLVGRVMIRQNEGGSIINITSVAAELASPNNPAYNAAKGGLRQMSRAFAADWAEHNIRVNNLGPGYFNTELNAVSWNDPELREIRANRSLLHRWAEPYEIVGPAILLASEASSFITGQDVYVDGGFLSKSL